MRRRKIVALLRFTSAIYVSRDRRTPRRRLTERIPDDYDLTTPTRTHTRRVGHLSVSFAPPIFVGIFL